MNRRGFLGLLAATPVAAVLAPDLVELLAPKRTIFLPPRGGWNLSRYFTSDTAWFLKTEPPGLVTYQRSGIMTAAQFRQQLAAGLNEVYAKAYDRHGSDWDEVFR